MIPRSVLLAGVAVAAAATSLITATARPDGSPDVAALDGAQVFRIKGCATCHIGPDGNQSIQVGPSLTDAASWAADRVEGMSAEEYIEQSIRSPSALISPAYRPNGGGPGGSMPLLRMSDDEIDAVVSYLLEPDPLASNDGTE